MATMGMEMAIPIRMVITGTEMVVPIRMVITGMETVAGTTRISKTSPTKRIVFVSCIAFQMKYE
jgi:hypothetical protein